ncbi:class I SAM-dependent methyltransferase [Chryseobacterium camelliae]|uniref:class I SAM-dependent methyltransferase n=1 Tax=Chryseobacterium camelliae TaxID=1265445 RepID=UPI001E4CC865|nr:class I SAM-dependent methyltransferase [Chryseobacterium camelliae]
MTKILDPTIQEYIRTNINADLPSLLLKKSPFPEVTMQEIVQQIKGKRVAEKKFPFLLKEGIIFPPQINLEQASSEKTARYKADLLKGEKFIDLTAGFCIDAFYLSEGFEEVTLVEQNSVLLETVKHNWYILGREARFISGQLEDFLQGNEEHFDIIYLDPARRDQQKNKVFLLEDLSPNILDIQDRLLAISETVVIKLSPLIDLTYLLSVLPSTFRIDIIAVKNDVKEVVIFLSGRQNNQISCWCVNLESGEPPFTYTIGDEETAHAEYAEPGKYLYIPNNAILKAGTFNLVSQRFNLKKLHPNTHFYTSDHREGDFPGRILEVECVESKDIKKKSQFNIISRNHPLKPEEIRKKYQLKDGGEHYLIFTQSKKGKIILKSV